MRFSFVPLCVCLMGFNRKRWCWNWMQQGSWVDGPGLIQSHTPQLCPVTFLSFAFPLTESLKSHATVTAPPHKQPHQHACAHEHAKLSTGWASISSGMIVSQYCSVFVQNEVCSSSSLDLPCILYIPSPSFRSFQPCQHTWFAALTSAYTYWNSFGQSGCICL